MVFFITLLGLSEQEHSWAEVHNYWGKIYSFVVIEEIGKG